MTRLNEELKKALENVDLDRIKYLVALDTTNELGEYKYILKKNLKTLLTQAVIQDNAQGFHELVRVCIKNFTKLRYYPMLLEEAIKNHSLKVMDSWVQQDPALYQKIIEQPSFFVSCLKNNCYKYFKEILSRTQTRLTDYDYYLEAFSYAQKATLGGAIDDILKEKPHALNYATETNFFADLALSRETFCVDKFKEYVNTVKEDLFYAPKHNRDMVDNIVSSGHIDNLHVILNLVPLYRNWIKKRVEFGFYEDNNKMIERALLLCEKYDLNDKVAPSICAPKSIHKI